MVKNLKKPNLAERQKPPFYTTTVFDDMIADIEYNKNFKRIIKELFYRAGKINISIVFITQSYFRALKDAMHSTHYILMKICNNKELKSIAEEK